MKTHSILSYSAIILLLAGLMINSSCNKLKDAADGAKLIIDYNLIETTIDVQFYDAATGELIGRNGDVSVNALITGRDSDGVMDITGLQHPSMQYASQRGMLGLALMPNPSFTPSLNKPVSFNIVGNVPGYLKSGLIWYALIIHPKVLPFYAKPALAQPLPAVSKILPLCKLREDAHVLSCLQELFCAMPVVNL
jgi:hypothetical protein